MLEESTWVFEEKPGNIMQFCEEQQHKVNDVPSKEFTKIFKGFLNKAKIIHYGVWVCCVLKGNQATT